MYDREVFLFFRDVGGRHNENLKDDAPLQPSQISIEPPSLWEGGVYRASSSHTYYQGQSVSGHILIRGQHPEDLHLNAVNVK